jgi:formylglycine-generating enzyme required for sulfatase activity
MMIETRKLKGGAWHEPTEHVTSPSNNDYPPFIRTAAFGFRLVLRNPNEQTKETKE